jgi:hypothetical protein
MPTSDTNNNKLIVNYNKSSIMFKKLKLMFFPYLSANIIFNFLLLSIRYYLDVKLHIIHLSDSMYSINIPLCFTLFFFIKWLNIPVRLSKKQFSLVGILYTMTVFWFLYYPAHLIQKNMNSYLYRLVTINDYQQINQYKHDKFFKLIHTSLNMHQPIVRSLTSYTTQFSDSSDQLHMRELLAIPFNTAPSPLKTAQIWLVKIYKTKIPAPSSPRDESIALNQFTTKNQANFSNIVEDNLLSATYFFQLKNQVTFHFLQKHSMKQIHRLI